MSSSIHSSNLLPNLLAKHKIIGMPALAQEQECETKEEALAYLEKQQFFSEIRKCEMLGVCIGYDELIKYVVSKENTPEEESKTIESLLKAVLQDSFHSHYLTVIGEYYYLYVKYTQGIFEKIRVGPVVTTRANDTKEASEFKKMWDQSTEYRRFSNGQVRVCVSLEEVSQHSISYIALSKIFSLKVAGGVLKGKSATRQGTLLNPVISIEEFDRTYNTLNSPAAKEKIKKTVDYLRENVPIKVQEAHFTSSMNRNTRVLPAERSPIYLRLGKGHRWPVEDNDLFSAAIIALNGVLGKLLEKKHFVEGLSEKHTLYATIKGEKVEFIFDVEEEHTSNIEKYNLMRFRVAYEEFFSEIVSRQKTFPQVCVQVKQFLYFHGLYPYYITDKIAELLCFRTAYKSNTISAGFRAAISTRYSYGYNVDIRRGKIKIHPKEHGYLAIVHASGCFSLALPKKEVFDRMNTLFVSALSAIEKKPGIDSNLLVTNVFQSIFSPNLPNASFSLSRTPFQGYTEIDHYSQSLGGCTEADSFSQCFRFLESIGCAAYFCKAGRLFVSVPLAGNIPVAIGASIMLTGMKYIRK